ncbi:unnamed protein product [Amoebophrya sp. A120]|nr:unnamed protein product [Amoebophrya sp. A120]|eukprot:GSA120T00006066001.1
MLKKMKMADNVKGHSLVGHLNHLKNAFVAKAQSLIAVEVWCVIFLIVIPQLLATIFSVIKCSVLQASSAGKTAFGGGTSQSSKAVVPVPAAVSEEAGLVTVLVHDEQDDVLLGSSREIVGHALHPDDSVPSAGVSQADRSSAGTGCEKKKVSISNAALNKDDERHAEPASAENKRSETEKSSDTASAGDYRIKPEELTTQIAFVLRKLAGVQTPERAWELLYQLKPAMMMRIDPWRDLDGNSVAIEVLLQQFEYHFKQQEEGTGTVAHSIWQYLAFESDGWKRLIEHAAVLDKQQLLAKLYGYHCLLNANGNGASSAVTEFRKIIVVDAQAIAKEKGSDELLAMLRRMELSMCSTVEEAKPVVETLLASSPKGLCAEHVLQFEFLGDIAIEAILEHQDTEAIAPLINAVDEDGWTLLHWLTFRERFRAVTKLLGLALGWLFTKVNAKTTDGVTAFGMALKADKAELAQEISKSRGFRYTENVLGESWEGRLSIIDHVAKHGSEQTKFVLDFAALASCQSEKECKDFFDAHPQFPFEKLDLASGFGHYFSDRNYTVIKFLLTDPAATNRVDFRKLLASLICEKQNDALKVLLFHEQFVDYKANFSVTNYPKNKPSIKFSGSCLHYAISKNNVDALGLLLTHPERWDILENKAEDGKTALEMAKEKNNREMISLLQDELDALEMSKLYQDPNAIKKMLKEKEQRAKAEGPTCEICLDRSCDMVLPCGHTLCGDCCDSMPNKVCPKCRKAFVSPTRLFF